MQKVLVIPSFLMYTCRRRKLNQPQKQETKKHNVPYPIHQQS